MVRDAPADDDNDGGKKHYAAIFFSDKLVFLCTYLFVLS